MRFKSRAPGLTTRIDLPSGHITEVGDEWQDLDEIYQGRALELGCMSEALVDKMEAEVKALKAARAKASAS